MNHITTTLGLTRFWRAAVLGLILAGTAGGPALPHAAPAQTASSQTAPSQTLYHRLGGYDGIAAYIALVFPRVAQHADLKHMFRGHGKDSQQRQFQLVVELICQRTGGPCGYVGRAMPPVHDGLGITEAHWTTFMTIVREGMNERGYPAQVRDEFLAVWRTFHDDVVQK
jgi:hemoglobin